MERRELGARSLSTVRPVDRAAAVFSYIVNPLVMPPLLLLALLAHFRAPWGEMLGVGATAFVFFTALPLAFLVIFRLSGRSESLEVRDRAGRLLPYLFCLCCSAAALAVLYVQVATARPVILAVVVLLNVNAALLLLINSRLKISIHSAAVAGAVGILLLIAWAVPAESVLDPVALMWLTPAVPGVMWARVRTGAHSRSEVLAGAAFGSLVPVLELSLCLWSGLLV